MSVRLSTATCRPSDLLSTLQSPNVTLLAFRYLRGSEPYASTHRQGNGAALGNG
jgi:hypothetical protein